MSVSISDLKNAAASCDYCGKADATSTWRRRLPGVATARFCANCREEVRRNSNDRGADASDSVRIAGIYSNLAGEVWSDGDTQYWFRAPILHRPDGETTELVRAADLARVPNAKPKRASVKPRAA